MNWFFSDEDARGAGVNLDDVCAFGTAEETDQAPWQLVVLLRGGSEFKIENRELAAKFIAALKSRIRERIGAG